MWGDGEVRGRVDAVVMVAKQGDMLSATAKIPKVRVRRRDATYPSIVLNALSNNRVNFQFPFFGGHLEGQCNVTEVPRPGLKPREILGRSKGQDTNGCDRVIESFREARMPIGYKRSEVSSPQMSYSRLECDIINP